MKTLVLYESKTGSTKQYAEDIARRVDADVFPLKKFKLKNMASYDTIVFGGWVRGGEIIGLNKFLQAWDSISDKNVLIFGVGMSVTSKEGREQLINQNLLDMYHLRFYQVRGSFHFEKLGFLEKIMIKASVKQFQGEGLSPEQSALGTIIETPIEWYDTEKINRIVSVIETLTIGGK